MKQSPLYIAVPCMSPESGANDAQRIAVVVGGTDGIGKEIALGLARRHYRLIVAGRDAVKGARASDELIANGASGAIFLEADLSLIGQARRLAELITGSIPRLHVLVHSAGVVLGSRQLTAEGLERNFTTNYLSRFVLTQQLLPLLERSGSADRPAKILLIGGGARGGKIYFDDVNLTGNFRTLRAVLQICKTNDTFAIELARRLLAAQANVDVACLKVGVVKTNIRRTFPRWMKWLVPILIDPLLAQPASTVADSAQRLIAGDERSRDGVLFSHILRFKRLRPERDMIDRHLGMRLWALSEQLSTGALAVEAGSRQ